MLIDALSVLCAQLTRDLLAIAKFLLSPHHIVGFLCDDYVCLSVRLFVRLSPMHTSACGRLQHVLLYAAVAHCVGHAAGGLPRRPFRSH